MSINNRVVKLERARRQIELARRQQQIAAERGRQSLLVHYTDAELEEIVFGATGTANAAALPDEELRRLAFA